MKILLWMIVPVLRARALLVCFLLWPVAAGAAVRKLHDVVIYEDAKFYAAFPSIVRRPDGELLVAFRRAPERREFGEGRVTHTDPNSYLELVRSKDNGRT